MIITTFYVKCIVVGIIMIIISNDNNYNNSPNQRLISVCQLIHYLIILKDNIRNEKLRALDCSYRQEYCIGYTQEQITVIFTRTVHQVNTH